MVQGTDGFCVVQGRPAKDGLSVVQGKDLGWYRALGIVGEVTGGSDA